MPKQNGCRLAITVGGIVIPQQRGIVIPTAPWAIFLYTPHRRAVAVYVNSVSIFLGVPEDVGAPCLLLEGAIEIQGRLSLPDKLFTPFGLPDRETIISAHFFDGVEVMGINPNNPPQPGLFWDPWQNRWFRHYINGGTITCSLTVRPVGAKEVLH